MIFSELCPSDSEMMEVETPDLFNTVAKLWRAQCEKHAGTAFRSWQQQKRKRFGMRRFSVFEEAVHRTL